MSFYAKSVSFWANEWIFKYSDKIMSCKLWSKVTSVFLNINFCAKMSILGKKNWISWEMLIFSNNCALLLKVNILLENMLIFRKLWLFVWYTSRNCRILIKTSIFLRKCLFVHVLIFNKVFYLWKIVILIQNMILFGDILEKLLFWFKIWFYSVIFWKKCHFPSKIYISGGIDFLEKSSNFFWEKVLI